MEVKSLIAAIYFISVIILFILSVVKYIKHLRTPRAERKAGPTLFFVIMTILFAGAAWMLSFVIKFASAFAIHEYKVTDTSDAIYCTNHFDDNCLVMSEYTACNGDSIVYVNGSNLYRLSDNQVVLENVQIRKMLYTDYYLYVLDDKDVFHIIDMDTMSTYKVQNISAFYYDNMKIYLSAIYPNISGLYGVDEESIIKNGKVVPFDQMEDVDDVAARKIKCRIFDGNGYYYWTNCDRKEVSVCRKRVEETENIKDGICLDDDYIISDNDLSIYGENAYILYSIHSGQTKYQNTQKETYRDGIISLDFDKEKSKIIYETEDNTSRIIGFDGASNAVYEFTADSAGIYGFSCPAMTIYIGETKEQYASTTLLQYQYLPVQLDAGETRYIMCIGAESDTLSIQKTPVELSVGDNIICGKTDSNRPWYTFTPEKDGVYFFQGVDDRRYTSLYVTETSEIADFHPYLYVGGGVEMTANTTYYVYSNTNGNYPLTIEEQNLVLEEGNNDVASNFYGIWYEFTPEETGCYQFSTEALGWITVNTKKNSNVDDGAKVGDSTNPVKMNLQAGETYNVFVQFNYGKYDLAIEKLDLNLVDGDNDVFVVDSESKTWYSYKATQDGIATFNFEAENGAMTISASKDGDYIYSGSANEAFHMCIEKDQVYYVGIAGNEGDYSLSIDVVSDELTYGANVIFGQNNQPIWYKYTADKDQVVKMTLEGESNAGGATINETKDGTQLSNMSCGSSGYVMLEEGQSCYVHLVTPSGDYILTVEDVLDTFAIVPGENTVYSQGSCPTWYEFEAPADGIYSFKANVGGGLYLNSSKKTSGAKSGSSITGLNIGLSEGDVYYVGIYCPTGPVTITATKANDVLTVGTNDVVTIDGTVEAWYTFTPDTTGIYRFLTDVDGGTCINESKTTEGATSTTMSKTSPLVVELTKDTTYYIAYKYAAGNHTIEVEQLVDTLSLVLGENEVYSKGTGATWYEFEASADGIYNFKADVAGTIYLNASKSTSGAQYAFTQTGCSVMLSKGDVYYVGITCPTGPVSVTAKKVNDVLTVGTNEVVTIGGFNDAWYTFTPDTTGIYRFVTDVDGNFFINESKTTTGATSSSSSKQRPVIRELTKDTTYYISYRYAAADHSITVETMANELSIGADNEIYAGTPSAPVWYEFTAPYSGTFGFKTTCSSGSLYACTDKQTSNGYEVCPANSTKEVKLEEGATVYLFLYTAYGKYGMEVSVISIDNAPNMPEDAMDVVLINGEQTVADLELPDDWAWEDDAVVLPTEAGKSVDAVANYTGEDVDLYVNKSVTISITMVVCEHKDATINEVVDVAATCGADGKKHTVCEACGFTVEEDIVIPATGKHNYEGQEYISTGEDSHYQECAVCGQASEPEACTGGEATSDKKAVCTVCHAEYGELAPIANGWLQDENGNWTYMQDGKAKTGWLKLKDVWYYMNTDGIMQTGWVKVSGVWYYFSASGAMQTGWVKVDGTWYYFNASGAMQTGWVKVDSTWYYFNTSGAMQKGWQKLDGKWYYFGTSGAMVTGWQKLGETWYYFGTSGAMLDGWQMISNKWYYFDNGAMVTGWRKINNKWYYFYSSGAMAADTTIDGYYINASGVYVP